MGDQDQAPQRADDWRSRRPQTWQGWVYRLGLTAFVLAMIVLAVNFHQIWALCVMFGAVAADYYVFRRGPKRKEENSTELYLGEAIEAQNVDIRKLYYIIFGGAAAIFFSTQIIIYVSIFILHVTKYNVITTATVSVVLSLLWPLVALPVVFLNRRKMRMPLRQALVILAILAAMVISIFLKAIFEFKKDWHVAIVYGAFGVLILSITTTLCWPLGDKKPGSAPPP